MRFCCNAIMRDGGARRSSRLFRRRRIAPCRIVGSERRGVAKRADRDCRRTGRARWQTPRRAGACRRSEKRALRQRVFRRQHVRVFGQRIAKPQADLHRSLDAVGGQRYRRGWKRGADHSGRRAERSSSERPTACALPSCRASTTPMDMRVTRPAATPRPVPSRSETFAIIHTTRSRAASASARLPMAVRRT